MKRLSVIVCLFMFALMPLLAQVKQTVAVLGDSYSTFEGFIPKGYATWYTTAVQKVTDVNKVEQTWWWQVIKEGGYKMGNINSYSGSTICNTGYRDEDYSDRSFINRTTLLGNPDIILICGGTNDSWANAPIGNYQYSNWKRADLYFHHPTCHLNQVAFYHILNNQITLICMKTSNLEYRRWKELTNMLSEKQNGSILQFTFPGKQAMIPYILYFDFRSAANQDDVRIAQQGSAVDE
jgi:hypothetical protein